MYAEPIPVKELMHITLEVGTILVSLNVNDYKQVADLISRL
jgi:hypothetical protein